MKKYTKWHPPEATQHPLHQVFDLALEQATQGKGERHGGDSIPFMDQPWVHYAKMHGRGFLTGQAAKKLEEAASTREGDAFVHEVLGAIVYASMAILHELQLEAELAERVMVEEQIRRELETGTAALDPMRGDGR
jgi:hypothetical protein